MNNKTLQDYLKSSISQSENLLHWISQKEFAAELEQFEGTTTDLCEIFEVGAKDPTLFVFSSQRYIEEIEEHRFKTHLSSSAKTFKLLKAIKEVKDELNTNTVAINHIIRALSLESIQESHKYISHLLSLAYYFNWEMEQIEEDIETQSCITVPDVMLLKIKERFNLNNMLSLYEDNSICIYLNAKNRLICYFKSKKEFSKDDIIQEIFPALEEVLQFNSISLIEKQ